MQTQPLTGKSIFYVEYKNMEYTERSHRKMNSQNILLNSFLYSYITLKF